MADMREFRRVRRRAMARARLFAHVVADLGLPMVGRVALNSLRSNGAARRRRRERALPVAKVLPGRLVGVEPVVGGARFAFEHAELEVAMPADDVVCLTWGPGSEPVPYALVEKLPWEQPQVAVVRLRADSGESCWDVMSDELAVRVFYDGVVELNRRDGIASRRLLRRSAAPARTGCGWEQLFETRAGERFSGLGEQAGGVDLSGGRWMLWNTDTGGSWGPGSGPLYTGIPVLVASGGEGSLLTFYDNSTRATFAFPEPTPRGEVPSNASVSFAGGRLRSYTMSGSLPQLLDRYTELTGRPSMPARWTLGYHQSRWGYKTEDDIRYVVEGFAREGLPLSAVHLDIDYMDRYRVFTIDRRRFPDMAALAADAERKGVRLVAIVDPGVKVDPRYEVYREGLAEGLFCRSPEGAVVEGVAWPGRAVFPDFTDPRARSWWAGKYEVLASAGISGLWHDMNEPSSMTLAGDPTLPLETCHDFEGRGGDHAEGHNLYGLLMNRAGSEGFARSRPGRRPFVLSRSGWASNQRSAWNWTGDVVSTWAAMRQQVATLVGLGLSGQPFCGSDIGGFSGVPDEDLYLRWLQMSVFVGFCRTHAVVGTPPREPWRFAQPIRTLVGAWIRFRYRLLPYLYSLAHVAAETGAPLVRPLWWGSEDLAEPVSPGVSEDACDAALPAVHVDDEFLLGGSLLVAPVCEPDVTTRAVAFPPGTWTSLWGDSRRPHGGDRVHDERVETPLERTPVFVRSGTVLPLDDAFAEAPGPCRIEGDDVRARGSGSLSADHAPGLLAFHCWAGSDGRASGTCFEDAGDGYGPTRTDEIGLRGALESSDAVVTWGRDGSFPAPSRVRVVLHGFESDRVVRDGEDLGATSEGAIECGAFDRLELRALRRAASRRTT